MTYLFGHSVPVQMALTLVHILLVQELTLVRNQQGIAHKFSNYSMENPHILIRNKWTASARHHQSGYIQRTNFNSTFTQA